MKKTKKKKPIKNKASVIVKALKIDLAIIVIACLIYIILGVAFERNFLTQHLPQRIGRVAGVASMSITMAMIDTPPVPTLTTTPQCIGATPYVRLSWTDEGLPAYFDIERDGQPLVTGIVENTYDDYAVLTESTHTYRVTAFNQRGNATSDYVSATTGDCIVPTCSITWIGDVMITNPSQVPSIKDKTPRFQGNTNLPSADIDIAITGKRNVSASTIANSNGYWSWKPLDKLVSGNYRLAVTATDPNNPAKTASANLNFIIEGEQSSDDDDDVTVSSSDDSEVIPPAVVETPDETSSEEPQAPQEEPVQPEETTPVVSIDVQNEGHQVYTGEEVGIDIQIDSITEEDLANSEIIYRILDDKDDVIWESREKVTLTADKKIKKKVYISHFVKPGRYKVSAQVVGKKSSSSEDYFIVEELAIANLGAGRMITFGQVMDNLEITISSLSATLVLLSLLFALERRAASQAVIHITEWIFKGKGLIR